MTFSRVICGKILLLDVGDGDLLFRTANLLKFKFGFLRRPLSESKLTTSTFMGGSPVYADINLVGASESDGPLVFLRGGFGLSSEWEGYQRTLDEKRVATIKSFWSSEAE